MATTTKKTAKKPAAQKQFKDEFTDDPADVHIVYSADDHDPAYDDNIANDTAFDYDASEDSDDYDDHDEHRNNRK